MQTVRAVRVSMPAPLALKAEAFAAEMARRTGERTTLAELIVLSLAQYVHGEHLLSDYYTKKKKKRPPTRGTAQARLKKKYMDQVLSDILKEATKTAEDGE